MDQKDQRGDVDGGGDAATNPGYDSLAMLHAPQKEQLARRGKSAIASGPC